MLTLIQRPNSEGTYLGENGDAKDAKLKKVVNSMAEKKAKDLGRLQYFTAVISTLRNC